MAELVTVGIIGGGAWGTALATVAARNNHRVMVWDINPDIGQSINRYHQHPFAFPDILLNENISGAENIEEVCKCPLILAAVPSQFMRETLARAEKHIESEAIVALCAKGIEIDSGKLMSEVAETILPHGENSPTCRTFPVFIFSRMISKASSTSANPNPSATAFVPISTAPLNTI